MIDWNHYTSQRSRGIIGSLFITFAFVAFSVIDLSRFAETKFIFFLYRALFLLSIASIYASRAFFGDTTHRGALLGYSAAMLHTFFPVLVVFISAASPLSTSAALGIISGLTIAALGLVDLGGSFGIAPANRGVKCHGVYGLVRHPIYLGYLVSFGSFCIAQAKTYYVMIFAAYLAVTWMRILLEEQELLEDDVFIRYTRRVKYRLIPLVI